MNKWRLWRDLWRVIHRVLVFPEKQADLEFWVKRLGFWQPNFASNLPWKYE